MSSTRRDFLFESLLASGSLAVHPFAWAQTNPNPTNRFLKGNFAPIAEEHTSPQLRVIGKIPHDLDGLFLRNGPNPQFPPTGAYHWFEGDGMLHGVRIRDGQASYRNRFVRTQGYQEEHKAGKQLYASILEKPDLKKALRGEFPFKNAANTAVVYHAGRCLALFEAAEPYEVKVPSLETVGPCTFNGKVLHPFAAHPKIDPETGEMLCFGYAAMQPLAYFTTVDPQGRFVKTELLKLDRPTMIHDFAITKHFAVFPVCPEVFDLPRAMRGESPWLFDSKLPIRFALVSRNGLEKPKWFEAKTGFLFHVLNAHETEEEVIVVGCRYERFPDLLAFAQPTADNKIDEPHASLYRWRMNRKTGQVTEGPLDDEFTEFPRINEAFIGKSNRWGYCGFGAGDFFEGFVKYDLVKGTKSTHRYGKKRFGGEVVFVERKPARGEDDGWLMTFVFDQETNKSELLILDSRDITSEPVARVQLPTRVPYGFHGTWIVGSLLPA